MKKIYMRILSLVVIISLLTGCTNNEKPNGGSNQEKPKGIVGKWQIITTKSGDFDGDVVWEFTENKHIKNYVNGTLQNKTTKTYELKNNTLTINDYIDKKEYQTNYSYEFNSDYTELLIYNEEIQILLGFSRIDYKNK